MSPLERRCLPAAFLASLFLGPLAIAGEDVAPGVLVDVLEDTPLTVTVQYQLEDFDQELITIDGKQYLAIGVHGEGFHNEVGAPDLPRIARSVLLPDRGATEVHVLSADFREIEGIDLVPARGPITRDIDPASVPYVFGPSFKADRWFPESPVSLRDPYVLRDARGVVVEANLFQYNPAKRALRIYDDLTVEVRTTGEPGLAEIDRSAVPARPDVNFEGIYERHFLNGSSKLAATFDRAGPDGQCGDMLIISYGPAMPLLQPLVDWKNSIGIHTTVVDIATVGNTPAQIKSYIAATYDASNLAYVLLVGDAAQVTSFTYQGGYSDPSFSTMTADWYPDLLVGRFSIQTPEHVTTMVDRTIAYEQAGHDAASGGWNSRAMGIASNEGPGHYGEYDNAHMELIRGQYLADAFTSVDPLYQPSATKAMVKAGIEDGRRFINYVGHGSSSSWGTTGFSSSDVNQLNNPGLLPVVHAVACVNGDFSKSECFAEAWLRATDSAGAPTGAVVTYMSTINQYWNEPMYGQACHGKSGKYSYVDLFLQDADWSVGGLWFGGSATMMDIAGSSGRDMFMTWTIFGDPSLCIDGKHDLKTLVVDNLVVPMTSARVTNFTLTLGPSAAGHSYFLLAGVSGEQPGTQLAGGEVLPLNVDAVTIYGLGHPFGPLFQGFFGVLDGVGEASPSFDSGPMVPLDPAMLGLELVFAGATWATPDAMSATNPVVLTVTP